MRNETTIPEDEVIDAMADAGLLPEEDGFPTWTHSWDAVADVTDSDDPADRGMFVVARHVRDDERVSVMVADQFGCIHVELSFPATDVGLAMMIGAIEAVTP